MDIKTYFEQADTPSAHSPIGLLMLKVLAKNPGMDFDSARSEANRRLDKAAKGRTYRTPRVYGPEEQAAKLARLKAGGGVDRPARGTSVLHGGGYYAAP